MLNPRRHGIRVFAYFVAELCILAAAFFAAYAFRQRSNAWWGQELQPLAEQIWMLPASLVIWGLLLWIVRTYEGFRSRNALMHAFVTAATCALGVLALFAAVTIFK